MIYLHLDNIQESFNQAFPCPKFEEFYARKGKGKMGEQPREKPEWLKQQEAFEKELKDCISTRR